MKKYIVFSLSKVLHQNLFWNMYSATILTLSLHRFLERNPNLSDNNSLPKIFEKKSS